MGSLLTALLFVVFLVGSCTSQSPTDPMHLILEFIAVQQEKILQKVDGQEIKENHQQTMIQDIQTKTSMIEEFFMTVMANVDNRFEEFHRCADGSQVEAFKDWTQTDECSIGSHNCSEMAICIDTCDEYYCSCFPGYTGDGFICEDVDECQQIPNVCGDEQLCINFPGSYACQESISTTNECESGEQECHPYATCTGTNGSYTCQCLPNFDGDGYNCTDINECELGLHSCPYSATCINTIGSYICKCLPYRYGDGHTCTFTGCISPAQNIRGLGCVKPVKNRLSWDEAQEYCQSIGAKLVEGIKKENMGALNRHFLDYITGASVHIGLRGGVWVTSGDPPVDSEGDFWMWEEPNGLGDGTSSVKDNFLCQFLVI